MSATLTADEQAIVVRLLEKVPSMSGAELVQAYVAAELKLHATERRAKVAEARVVYHEAWDVYQNALADIELGSVRNARERCDAARALVDAAEAALRALWTEAVGS